MFYVFIEEKFVQFREFLGHLARRCGPLCEMEQRGRSVGLSLTIVSPAKTAERIEMPFGVWTQVNPRNNVVDGAHIDATWRIRLNRPCAGSLILTPSHTAAFFVKLLWPLVMVLCSPYGTGQTIIFCYELYACVQKTGSV